MGQAQIIGTVFVSFGLLCAGLATALDYWCYVRVHEELSSVAGYALFFGLWNRCKRYQTAGTLVTTCTPWLDYRKEKQIIIPWLQVCQVLMILGTSLLASAILAALSCMKSRKQTRSAAYISCWAGVCCVTASVVFAIKRSSLVHSIHDQETLHAAFGLAVSAGLFGAVGSFFLWRHSPMPGYQNMDVL